MTTLLEARKAMIQFKGEHPDTRPDCLQTIEDYLDEQVAECAAAVRKDHQTQLSNATALHDAALCNLMTATARVELAKLHEHIAAGIANGILPSDFYEGIAK